MHMRTFGKRRFDSPKRLNSEPREPWERPVLAFALGFFLSAVIIGGWTVVSLG
jgi:hypothetical protein